MNEIKIFESPEFAQIKDFQNKTKKPYLGYVYVLEFGNKVKIGCTESPAERFTTLCNTANYAQVETGKYAVSIAHVNYRENEKALHTLFQSCRVEKTELFDISFEDVTKEIAKLNYDTDYQKKCDDSKRRVNSILKTLGYGDNFELCNDLKTNPEVDETTLLSTLIKKYDYTFWIKPLGLPWYIPLDSHKIYTACCLCGKEIDLSLNNIWDNKNGTIDLETLIACDECCEELNITE